VVNPMVNRYRKGRIAEKKVANRLKGLGWNNIRRSKGSRGPADIYARTPSGEKAYIQVKSGTADLTSKDRERLVDLAKERKGVAVYAHKDKGNKIKFRFLGNFGRRRKRKR